MVSKKRDHLIDTALELFYQDGFHATGVDKILEKAGVARMTLYNHFKSKDELILAALRRRDEKFRNWFMRTVERQANTPRERLLSMFDALHKWISGKEFSGCMFINASAEFSQQDNPIHAISCEHKILVLKYIQELTTAAGASNPEELADELMLLVEGAIVMAYVTNDHEAAMRAKKTAGKLIRLSFE
jgi:AcrR family transcriptional regulator